MRRPPVHEREHHGHREDAFRWYLEEIGAQDDEIRLLAHLDRPDPILQSQLEGAVPGGGAEGDAPLLLPGTWPTPGARSVQ